MPHTVALSLMNGHGSVGFDALLVEVIAEREEGAEEEREEPKEQEQGLEGGEEPKKIEIEEPEGSQVGLTGNGFFVLKLGKYYFCCRRVQK